MSTNLYLEAIEEAQQLKKIAEQNAKNKIIEALTPTNPSDGGGAATF